MAPTSKKIRNRGKIKTALSNSAFRPSATDLQASTRWTINCSAPCEESTCTVPPKIPIHKLKGDASRNLNQEVPGEGETFSQCSFPAWTAWENAATIPPSFTQRM